MVEDTQGWSFCVELSVLSIEGYKTSEPSLEEWQQTVAELKQVWPVGSCLAVPSRDFHAAMLDRMQVDHTIEELREAVNPSELSLKISISWKYSLRQIPASERQSSNWKRTSFAMDNPWQVFLMSWTDVFDWNKSRFIQGKAGINFARSCDSLRSAEIWLREGSLEQIGWGRYWWSGIFKTFELLSTKELRKPVFFLADSQKWREWSNGAISGMYWLIGWLRTGKRCFAKGLQQQGRQGRYSVEISTYFECLQEFFFWTECISV